MRPDILGKNTCSKSAKGGKGVQFDDETCSRSTSTRSDSWPHCERASARAGGSHAHDRACWETFLLASVFILASADRRLIPRPRAELVRPGDETSLPAQYRASGRAAIDATSGIPVNLWTATTKYFSPLSYFWRSRHSWSGESLQENSRYLTWDNVTIPSVRETRSWTV